MNLGVAVAGRIVRRVFAVLVLVVPTVVLVSAVDRGGDAWPPGTVAMLVGPVGVAVGTAWAVAELRSEGAWDAAIGLGHAPARLFFLPVAVAALIGVLSLAMPGPDSSTGISTVPPVPVGVSMWPAGDGWEPVDPVWTVPPARLSLRALLQRMARPGPEGSSRGVDRGEVVRRFGWALGFVWATVFGAFAGLVAGERRAGSDLGRRAVGIAFVLESAWLVAVLVASAYASSSMT